jgi:hypothetical protein
MELINTQRYYVQISHAEFHGNLTINVEFWDVTFPVVYWSQCEEGKEFTMVFTLYTLHIVINVEITIETHIFIRPVCKLTPLSMTFGCDIQSKSNFLNSWLKGKGKGHAQNRPQVPKGVPGRLRPRIFLTLDTTRVVGRQPHAPATFTPRGNPWSSFIDDESTPGHMVPSVATEKIPTVTPLGIDPETVRLVAQCLNHLSER